MTGQILHLSAGKRSFAAALPQKWRVLQTLEPRPSKGIDVERELREALKKPLSAPSPFGRDYAGQSVCVVVDDASRPTPVRRIFPALLSVLMDAGLEKSRLLVLVATGTHAPMSPEGIRERLGIDDPGELTLLNHDCYNEEGLMELGTTPSGMPVSLNRRLLSADHVFSIGTIEPHIMAGFGGGYKNIVPGCAGLKTIMATHLMGAVNERFGNVGEAACAVRRRIDEAASLYAPPCFLVNTVLDTTGEPVGIFCGDPLEAHRQGAALAREVWGIPISSKADVLIGTSHPMTHDLCQGSKAFAMGVEAVRPGGAVLLTLPCENGVGDYCVPPTRMTFEESRAIIRAEGTERYAGLRERELGRPMEFYEKFLVHSNAEALRKADIFVWSPDLPRETLERFGLFRAFGSLEEMISAAETERPEADCIVSACCGACFPRLA